MRGAQLWPTHGDLGVLQNVAKTCKWLGAATSPSSRDGRFDAVDQGRTDHAHALFSPNSAGLQAVSEGWICLHRGWRENPIFRGEFSRADAWIWLIENACWKPTKTRIKGDTLELQRGELSFSQRFLADKWGWSKSRVDRFIADLREETMIETRSKIGATAGHNAGQGQCILTICNYAKYQDVANTERGNDSQQIGATAGQQRGKEEQGNKETINNTVAKATVVARAKAPSKIPMDANWHPAPLPPEYADMVSMWPEGREARELAEFKDYWIEQKSKRPGWDRTWRSRINDRHDRIMRETKHGNISKPIRRADGVAAALNRRLGLDDTAGAFGQRDAGNGGGNSQFTLAAPRSMR